jgi:dienelactone hydrolase
MTRPAFFLCALFCATLLSSGIARAEIVTGTADYSHDGTALEGYFAYDSEEAAAGPLPAVMVIHAWKGLGEYEMMRARMLAEEGYYAFAVDVYGKGQRPQSREESAAFSGKYKNDRPLFRGRLLAAFEWLKTQPQVSVGEVAAIGYCFGGTGALELARSGAPVTGVVSFHGGLSSPTPADAANIKGKVLVLHGAADPNVPMTEVTAFADEMHAANIDWDLVMYGGAVHSFTEEAAGSDPSKGAAYDADADRRSWEAMHEFFDELFGEQDNYAPTADLEGHDHDLDGDNDHTDEEEND